MFDGKFRPVTGQQGSETAVEIINDKSTRILNKRDGWCTRWSSTHCRKTTTDQQRVHPDGQGGQDHGRHARDLHPEEVAPTRLFEFYLANAAGRPVTRASTRSKKVSNA